MITKRYSVSIVVGNDVRERVYGMDFKDRELALIAIETAMLRGGSVCVDVVEYDDDAKCIISYTSI